MSCEKCAQPAAFWEGIPSGKEVKLQGISAYFSIPSGKTDKAVVLIPDIHGWEIKNTRLLADKFAAAGFYAVLPDFFEGDNPELEPILKGDYSGFMEWRKRHDTQEILSVTDKVLGGLRAEHSASSFGVIGFCWGGKYAAILGASDKVKAVVINHGSFVEREEIEALKKPTLINGSDNDPQISREKLAQFRGLLDCKSSVPSDVKLFEGAEHGWTCRGDSKDPIRGPQIVEAHDRAIAWFEKYV